MTMIPTPYAERIVDDLPTVVKTGGGVPVVSWAVDAEPGALEQADNLAHLPFAIDHVALMPDAHQGYGMPVGGVLFAEMAVVPYAIGVDIGCGVTLIETDLTAIELERPDVVKTFLAQVARDVPHGNGPQAEHRQASSPLFQPPDGTHAKSHLLAILERAERQLGTLGGGNHFLELQVDDDGHVWFMLHSGSRSVGKKVCDHHHKIALEANHLWHSRLPHAELAYLPWRTDEAREYWNDMTVALAWAEENRRRMTVAVIGAFRRVFDVDARFVLDIHHNYAAWENHLGRNGIVHRKGAVRARDGETVLIPGSMGTASYVARGLGNPRSFMTCQHGAGRARSRGATRRMTSVAEMNAQLEEAGVTLVTPTRDSVLDESSIAYKDIEEVMLASSTLVEPVRRHRPVGVVKG